MILVPALTLLSSRRRGVGIDPDAAAYFVERSSLSTEEKAAVNRFIGGLKADGLWSEIIDAMLMVGGEFSDLMVKLKGTPSPTNTAFVSGDFVHAGATAGLKGDASTKWVDTNLRNDALTQTDFHLSVYNTEMTFENSCDVAFGRDASNTLSIFGNFGFTFYGFGGEQSVAIGVSTEQIGHKVVTRISSTDLKLLLEGKVIGTNTTPDTGAPTQPDETGQLFGILNASTTIHLSARRLTFYSAGYGLTVPQAAAFTGRVNRLMDDMQASPFQITGPYFAPLFYNPDQTLRLVQSVDGATFTKLPCSRTPADVPVRDPSLLIEDDFWWIVHTTAAFVAGTSFALCKAPAKSGAFVEVANPSLAAISGVQSPWGPKWFRDPADNSLHVIICVSVNLNAGPFKMYEIHPTNAERTTWSDPVEITGTSLPTNIIDAFLFTKPSDPGAYYILCKNEDSKYLELLRSETGPFSGYTVFEDAATHGGGQHREGCSVVNTSGLNWSEYADFYQEGTGMHYRTSSDDMATWGSWSAITSPVDVPRNGVFIKSP